MAVEGKGNGVNNDSTDTFAPIPAESAITNVIPLPLFGGLLPQDPRRSKSEISIS